MPHRKAAPPPSTARALKNMYEADFDPLKWLHAYFDSQPVDTMLALWYGVVFSDHDRFVRHDMSFLHAIFRQDRHLIFRRLSGCIMSRANTQEPYLLFTLKPVSKITSGERLHRRVLTSDLMEHETSVAAGLYKVLEYGSANYKINRNQASDVAVLDLLKTVRSVQPGDLPMPDWHLSCRPSNTLLYLRQPVEPQYRDPTGRLPDLIWMRENRDRYSIDAGKGSDQESRVAYPYDQIYGRGIVVSDCASYGGWTQVSMGLNVQRPEITIEL